MKRQIAPGLCALVLVLSLPVFAQERDRGLADAVNRPAREARPGAETLDIDPVTAQIQALSLEEQIAQLMLVTLEGMTGPDNRDRQFLRHFPPGGVLIPKIVRPLDGVMYVRALGALLLREDRKIPLFIGADAYPLMQHELPREAIFAPLPSALSIAAAGQGDWTRTVSSFTGRNLKVMGFNLHWGPNLELASTLDGSKGSIHNFGSDPQRAAEAAGEVIPALEEEGILAVPTGFPGGGANRAGNSPAVLLTPRDLLPERDLLPFIRAIEAGVQFIHIGNTLVPLLDPAAGPASLSAVVMQGLLRNDLGFTGVAIAGPLDSPDITRRYDDLSKVAMRALEAGADMLYWTSAGGRVVRTIGNIAVAVEKGEFDRSIIDRALRRILTLKEAQELAERNPPDEQEAKRLEKNRAKFEGTYRLERRAVTLVQNRSNILPLTKDDSMPIGLTGMVGLHELEAALEEYIGAVARQPIATAKHIGRIQDFEIQRVLKRARGVRTVVCVFTGEVKPEGAIRLIRAIQKIGGRVVAVLLGYPEHLARYQEADAIVLAYGDANSLDTTMRAVADILAGNAPLDIFPAVRDLERAPGEEVVFDVLDVVRSPTGRLPSTIADPFVAGYSIPYDPTLALDKVAWDFGDGKTSRDATATHAYEAPGRYPVTLTVTDQHGETATGTFHVVVK